ncbi:MAG: hypothetical protein Q7V31_16080 [Parvibaculum sp.]|uniref:hypothetical protein n=1 Tax=Parvibaculum sp. TaxID=2024848 RepID=UPI00271E419B|nr:hypothetical protein [Parvibaculum sp.]MDO8840432.1 hypothetical protein [Parvibaculum sp.]
MFRDPMNFIPSSRAMSLYIARYMTADGRQYDVRAIEAADDAAARRIADKWDCDGEIILLRVRDVVFLDHHKRPGAAP